MTATNRDLIHALRQGELISIADETGWSVAVDPQNETAVQQLIALKAETKSPYPLTVLAKNADQVALYVLKMPDVGFDLVEFSEIPLTIIFDRGKNVAGGIGDTDMAVRKSADEAVQFLLGGFGKGVLTLPFESFTLPEAAKKAASQSIGTPIRNFRKPRIMKLGEGGEVEFIRK